MSNGGNALWNEKTAAAALLTGVVVVMIGLGIALSLRAVLAGSVVSFVGLVLASAAVLTYRM